MSDSVTPVRGPGGLDKLVIDHPAAEGEIYLHGAHVTHWKPADADPVLWMSPRAVFAPGKAIRGGIPVCLPWFGPLAGAADAPAHGLVRTRAWDPVETLESSAGVTVRLRTGVGAGDSPHWPHPFTAELTATFGRALLVTLKVTNAGPEAFRFEEALHTYLRVHDVREAGVGGLADTDYVDKAAGGARQRETRQTITFTQETDRVYVGTEATCVVHDPRLGRRIVVEKSDGRSTVVWNPFPGRAEQLGDVGVDAWPGFVCVESGNVGQDAVTLDPGASHELRLMLHVEPPDDA